MEVKLASSVREVVEKVPFFPTVSVIMPFNPKMGGGYEIQQELKRAKKIICAKVLKQYNDDLGILVLQKLVKIFNSLNMGSPYESVAIFVSPVFEKVVYLNFPVEEKIMVDDSFSIQEIVHAKKKLIQYLLIDLTDFPSKVYFGDSMGISLIKKNYLPANDALLNMELQILMETYDVPVFIAGADEELNRFKLNANSQEYIQKYIPVNGRKASAGYLHDIASVYFPVWADIYLNFLTRQIDKYRNLGKLACGLKAVSVAIHAHKPYQLIIKKSYIKTFENIKMVWDETNVEQYYNSFAYVKSKLDEIIEQVLEEGGTVDFADDELVDGYNNIYLIYK